MEFWDLPTDAIEFLRVGRQLTYDHARCEPGYVQLKRLDDLELGEVWISPDLPGDPHAGEEGFYRIPSVSLTGLCEAYDPEFILLWLPHEQMFGTWDCDHWVLSAFPDVNWTDIVTRPAAFINSQWDAESSVARSVEPWHHHKFVLGRPF
jgi:hypothetical protein